jgi:hypothetical protein
MAILAHPHNLLFTPKILFNNMVHLLTNIDGGAGRIPKMFPREHTQD